ncbi:MAG: biotin/lipoyl-containing protein [Acetobacter sp.]
MEKPITLPEFAELPTAQDLVQITHWLQRAGLHELELTNAQGIRLRVVAEADTPPAPLPPTAHAAPVAPDPTNLTPVNTPYFGHLRLQDPVTRKALAPVGHTVQVGQTVAMLDLGTLCVPVHSPMTGVVATLCAHEGDLVGYGQTILSITPA